MTAIELASERHRVPGFLGAQALFLDRGWTDGLPIIPPTEELVARFVAASGRGAQDVVAAIPEQGREVTVEKIAVNAVMAGCRPYYMPILVAAMRAMSDPRFSLHSTTVSGATAPLLIVSGPAVRALGINASFSVFGPGHQANATLGRAVRLILQNVCGGTPGQADKATLGHPGKYSYCIGESSDRNPWDPFGVQHGLPADTSAVTVFAAEAPIYARNDWSQEPELILATVADAMLIGHYTGGSFVVVMSPLHAGHIAQRGWSPADVRRFLAERARRSVADLKRAGRLAGAVEPADEDHWRGAVDSPEQILIVVAGGHLYGYSAVVPPWVGGHESIPITLAVESPDAASRETSEEDRACLTS
ncbi:MAG: hypothetical protein H0V51_20890 [Chloroflexi bacterium]|nr:hypothetical protein [Chloroflexota bacterium]